MHIYLRRASALMLCAALAACGTAPKQNPNTIGGAYLVVKFEGLPERGGFPAMKPADWTEAQFLDLKDLNASCIRQIEPQLPAAASEIGRLGIRNAIAVGVGAGLGTGLGAIAAFTGVSFGDYAKYGGLSGAGSGLGAGIAGGMDRATIARNYAEYACMQWSVNHVNDEMGRLSGIGILPYAGSGRAKGVPNPGGSSVGTPRPPASSSHTGAAIPPS